jgi:ssDNA-binding Zn-finger/Zn-ribbon topoisomerase 1
MSGTGALSMPLIEAPLEFRTRSAGTLGKDKAFIICPKCEAPMFIRRSERMTETIKHLHAHCTNTGCGLTAAFEVGLIHVFNPGLIHRPDLNLPQCPAEKIPPARGGADDGQFSMFGGPS